MGRGVEGRERGEDGRSMIGECERGGDSGYRGRKGSREERTERRGDGEEGCLRIYCPWRFLCGFINSPWRRGGFLDSCSGVFVSSMYLNVMYRVVCDMYIVIVPAVVVQ